MLQLFSFGGNCLLNANSIYKTKMSIAHLELQKVKQVDKKIEAFV